MGPSSSTLQNHRATSVPSFGSNPPNATPSPVQAGPGRQAVADQLHAKQRDDLIASHMTMAARIARSFAGRGEQLDDLTQVAMLELVAAGSRFDPRRGVTFAKYVHPCIVGALKKHFRDNGWSLHITRRMQELHLQTSRAIPILTQLLGRTPTVPELAIYLDLSEQDTRDGIRSRLAYQTRSLNTPTNDGEGHEVGQLLGGPDDRLEAVPDRHTLAQHLAGLPARERDILHLRFHEDLSQREIAERLGISQMHVSRLLTRSILRLREQILA